MYSATGTRARGEARRCVRHLEQQAALWSSVVCRRIPSTRAGTRIRPRPTSLARHRAQRVPPRQIARHSKVRPLVDASISLCAHRRRARPPVPMLREAGCGNLRQRLRLCLFSLRGFEHLSDAPAPPS